MNRNITAIILIVLAIGTYVTFTRSKLAEVNAVRAVNTQYASAIANADQLVKVRDSVLKDYNNLAAEDRERLDKMLPNTVDNIRLIIDMDSIALRHGFSLQNMRASVSGGSAKPSGPATVPVQNVTSGAGATIPTPTLDTVDISFGVTTTYPKFIDLLHDLEANLRIMDVTRLNVAVNGDGTYNFGVSMKTYWLRQQ